MTKDELVRSDFYSWLRACYILPTGESYSFKGFEYLEEITKKKIEPNDQFFFEKPAQVGLSEILLAYLIWMNDRNLPKWKGCGYFFPARAQLQDHIKARFLPMFDYDNEKSRVLRSKLGQQNLRYISYNKKPIYFRSGQTRRELISIALDCVVIDEFDEFESPISVVPTLEARFGQSDYGFLIGASTPTIPEVGIDAAFSMSNQYNWYVPCQRCSKAFSPLFELRVRGFEGCVVKSPLSGSVGFVCPNCNDLTQTNGIPGKWLLDQKKDCQKYAWGLSKLFTPRHSLKKLLDDYEGALNLQEFYNSSLGIAYAAPNARLQRSVLVECSIGPEPQISSTEPTWAGIDVGKRCHWVVGKPQENGKKQILAYGACSFDELKGVCERFNVKYAVIDLRPYENEVKKFVGDKRSYMACDFNTGNQEDWYRINSVDEDTLGKTQRIIKADKTQCCDILITEIMGKKNFIFPNSTTADNLFINQMTAPVRMDKTNKDTGDTKAIYGNGGRADHYFFACVYLILAMQLQRKVHVRASEAFF